MLFRPGFVHQASYFRSKQCPGIELRVLDHCASAWWSMSTELELVVPETFRARVWYLRREYELAPGEILCVAPGQIFKVLEVRTPGALKTLSLSPEWLSASKVSPIEPAHEKRALPLLRAFRCLTEIEQTPACTLVATVHALRAALEGVPAADPADAKSRKPTRPGDGESLPVEGEEDCALPFRRHPRLSVFQAHRRFAHRNGLPPGAYRLCERVARAKQELRRGTRPSLVAPACGFTDQSHLTRHFKRLMGVTPARYVRATLAHPPARQPPQAAPSGEPV